MSRSSRLSRTVAVLCGAVSVALLVASCSAPHAPASTSRNGPGTAVPTAPTIPPEPEGSAEYSLTSGGLSRTYRLYVPADLPDPAPLVVMLHGGGGSGAIAERAFGWDAKADEGRFVVAYPDGLGPAVPAWNTLGDCCGYPAREGVDDVGFIQDMVAAIGSRIPLDDKRIYATGMSNGGMMAYTLACRTDLFAAIGPVSATMLDPCEHPAPASVIHIHGLRDTNVPFSGAKGTGTAAIDGPPIEQVIDDWRTTDDCATATTVAAGVVTTSTSTCAEGRAVELITIADGAHGWPTKPAARRTGKDGTGPSDALDATDTIWRFFSAHPKP
ncbi:MAG: polyhydroxybutyrate depolymerase [Actinobacteria bacterium]|nr:polyhydroxybutyrate depolymerase [Actinomycetota bacterium]